MVQTNNPNQNIDTDIQKANTKKEEQKELPKEVITPALAAERLSNMVLRYALDQVPMPQVRTNINREANLLASLFSAEQKKEFSAAVRVTFERMKQFMEASHQEVISLTSQIGWN